MRFLIFFVCVVLLYSCSERKNIGYKPIKYTKIDSITSLPELREFVQQVDRSLQNFLCKSPKFYGMESSNKVAIFKRRLDSMFPNFTFIKEDFDGNGYTDVVVTGEYYQNQLEVIAIMNSGKEIYTVIALDHRRAENFPIYPKLAYIDQIPIIELYSSYNFAEVSENGISKNTLAYKFGSFIDYMEPSETYQISKIEFSADGCYGSCPVFELILNKNSTSTFNAKYYNFSRKTIVDLKNKEGKFETIINNENYTEISDIISYLQIKNYRDDYFSGSFHDPSSKLKVYFTDGSTKMIHDNGMIGTKGLNFLYGKLYDLRFNQDWKKIKAIN